MKSVLLLPSPTLERLKRGKSQCRKEFVESFRQELREFEWFFPSPSHRQVTHGIPICARCSGEPLRLFDKVVKRKTFLKSHFSLGSLSLFANQLIFHLVGHLSIFGRREKIAYTEASLSFCYPPDSFATIQSLPVGLGRDEPIHDL